HNILLFFIWWSFNNGSKYVINFKSSKYNRLYWLVMTAGFFLLNMSSIIDKKIYVLSKNNMVEK
ncbi:hypothetical protein PXH78_33445, partial [Mycolicibacterium smegmatis]